MSSKRKRGSSWEFKVVRKGMLPPPGYKTFTFDTEDEGQRYCDQLEALLDRGIVPEELLKRDSSSLTKTFAEVAREYQGAQHISNNDSTLMRVNVEQIGVVKMSEITYDWAEIWIQSFKRKHNLAPNTIRQRVGAVARCLDWAMKKGYLAINPLRMLPKGYSTYTSEDSKYAGYREDIERDRRLEDGEEDRIRAVITTVYVPKHRQRALELENREAFLLMFTLAIETAMRMREIYTIQKRQVNISKRTIYLEKTKNGDSRQVPLSTDAIAALNYYFKSVDKDRMGPGDLIFPWWDGVPKEKNLKATTSRLSRFWDRIFDHAGCDDLGFHDLRHEATCRMYERTKLSDIQIARITGHKTLRMLKRYASLRGSDLAGELW